VHGYDRPGAGRLVGRLGLEEDAAPVRRRRPRFLLASREPPPPRAYIYAKRSAPGDVFRQFADKAKAGGSWRYYGIDASHNPHITCPQDLMATLTRIIAET